MKDKYGIALDIGTSGIRAQAIDLNTSKIISTAITLRHPLPGANVVDHLHFAIEVGQDTAHKLLIKTINNVIKNLNINLENVLRVAVCGTRVTELLDIPRFACTHQRQTLPQPPSWLFP